MRKRLVGALSIAAASLLAMGLPGTSAVARVDATVKAGGACASPLTRSTATVKRGKKRVSTALICWQQRTPENRWAWAAYDAKVHTPFALPASATWRRTTEPVMSGRPEMAGVNFAAGLSQLATSLDYYWIEVDVAGGYKVTAPVWAPKGRTNLPVIVHFHGTGGLIYWDAEYAARLASSGYVVVAPLWFGPRLTIESVFPASQMPGLFENPQGIPYGGANLELVRTLLPVVRAAASQPAADPRRVGVQGQSRGGTIALLMGATTAEITTVVGVVPPFLFSQLNNMQIRQLSPPGWETLPRDVVSGIRQPALVIVAGQDELVPPVSSQDFQQAAGAAGRVNIEFRTVDGPHTIAYAFNAASAAAVREHLLSFYARNL